MPEFQNRSSVLKWNAIKRLLTFGQPKYRLFLLCEGNGDGSGVHFLDSSKHEGYRLESIVAADLIKKSVNFLRFSLQVSFLQNVCDGKHRRELIRSVIELIRGVMNSLFSLFNVNYSSPIFSSFQLLIGISSVASIAVTLFDSEETLNTILGTIGLGGAVLSGVRWKNVFKEVCDVVRSLH